MCYIFDEILPRSDHVSVGKTITKKFTYYMHVKNVTKCVILWLNVVTFYKCSLTDELKYDHQGRSWMLLANKFFL